MWQRARSASKNGFDRAWGWADKLGTPVNNLSNKLGSEAFWPTTMDKECDKAARILRSFCKDGFQAVEEVPQQNDAEVQGHKQIGVPRKNHTKVLKRIPASVIRNAKGLAIFTTMRTGLWVSGAGGSGVLMARLPDGSWSCPSGIMLHTAGVGFLVGVDIYDCVMVLNTKEAVDAFSKIRCTVGGELSAVAGPIGVGGVLDSEVHARQAPIFTYLKSRGFYAGVQLDGTIIIERTDENERFYGRRVPVADILAGRVSLAPPDTQKLLQTVKMAQGDTDVDVSMLSVESAPSDFDIASGQVFGVPDREDPDPYGVLALENQGLVIREAGTQKEASVENFQFMPSPTSPLFGAFKSGQSWGQVGNGNDSVRSSWRTSLGDKSASSPKTSSVTLVEPSTANSSRPNSATLASKMAGIPEVDSIDQKLTQSAPILTKIDVIKANSNNVEGPSSARSVATSITDSNASPRSSKPPALPPRQTTKASRILQEQLLLAGQLRELISPTPEPSEKNTSQPNTPVTASAEFRSSNEIKPPAIVINESRDIPDVAEPLVAPAIINTPEQSHEPLAEAVAELDISSETTAAAAAVDSDVIVEGKDDISRAEAQADPETAKTSDPDQAVDADDEGSDWSSDDEDVVFHDVITATAPVRMASASPQLVSKARLVKVSLPNTPALPSRNPNRVRNSTSDGMPVLSPDSAEAQDYVSSRPTLPTSNSRTSSLYSAKEDVLSSTKGSDSLASVSSAEQAEGLGLTTVEFSAPAFIATEKHEG